MKHVLFGRTLAALLLGGSLLSACGDGGNGHTATSTPTSTLGTDSAATKVGGMADTTGAGGTMSAPAGGTGGTSMSGNGTTNTGSNNTAGTPTTGGTGASGTTNGTGAN